jgi:hypothetical protein
MRNQLKNKIQGSGTIIVASTSLPNHRQSRPATTSSGDFANIAENH